MILSAQAFICRYLRNHVAKRMPLEAHEDGSIPEELSPYLKKYVSSGEKNPNQRCVSCCRMQQKVSDS